MTTPDPDEEASNAADAPIELLVLGLGNPLYGDDGLGVAALEQLRRQFRPPPGVEMADGGTLGMALVPLLQRTARLILIDAVLADAPAGDLVRIEGRELPESFPRRLSPHEVGVLDLLFGTRMLGQAPDPVVVVGLVPERVAFGLERSEAVEASLPALVEAVAAEARQLGFPLQTAENDNARPPHAPRTGHGSGAGAGTDGV
jgi:hydrogenase maturation protease